MLQVDQIQVNYGAAPALWDVSLHVEPGELVSVIGPNGAGKTTLINAIMGLNALKAFSALSPMIDGVATAPAYAL